MEDKNLVILGTRPEIIDSVNFRIDGNNSDIIIQETIDPMMNRERNIEMSQLNNLDGDGQAVEKIVTFI